MAMSLSEGGPLAAEGSGLLMRLWRRKTWFVLGFGVTAGLVAAAFTALPRTYRASAALMVASGEAVLRTDNSSAEAQRLGDPADIESQMLMLRSPRLARMILDDPKVVEALVADCEATRGGTWATRLLADATEAPACGNLATDFQGAMALLQKGFSVGPIGRSRVIEVSSVSAIDETAVTMANALVDAYLRDDRERKLATHDNAIRWLTSEIERSGRELMQAELDVETYRNQNGIVRGQLATITSERLSELARQLAAAQVQAATARARLDMNRTGAGLQRELELANAQEEALTRRFNSLSQDVGRRGSAEAQIAAMVRNVEARREIYVEQLKKVNLLQTERRLLTGDARLVHYAELPERPWFPKRLPFLAVGLVLSSAAGAGLALLRDRGDRTLRASTNLPQVAGISVIGSLPWVQRKRGGPWPVNQLHAPSVLQEAVRALFSRCVLVPGQAPKTLMIGSADMGEGKTFLALSLGLFAATTGRRVLAIEADLRRPMFDSALDLPKGPGLSEFLQGDGPEQGQLLLRQIVRQYHGLHVITAGSPSVASTELLSGARFATLMRAAAAHYDLVIVDSPPSMLLMDAHVLARRVDGIIYCASYGRSRLDRVADGVRELGEAGGNVLGVVVGGRRSNELPGYGVSRPSLPSYMPVRA